MRIFRKYGCALKLLNSFAGCQSMTRTNEGSACMIRRLLSNALSARCFRRTEHVT